MSKKRTAIFISALLIAVMTAGCSDENFNIEITPGTALNQNENNEATEFVEEVNPQVTQQEIEETTEAPFEEITAEQTTVTESETEPAQTEPVTEPVTEKTPEKTQEPAQTEEQMIFIEDEVEPTYINGILIANKTYALPKSYAPGCLSTATQEAFNLMAADASAQGLSLWIASGYRSYDLQKDLYTRYCNNDGKEAADTYSARPGHSEHQTGLAFDLNSINDSFAYTAEGQWVAENCHKYGFIVRYPQGKESITGYKYEPWHLRYLGVETATAVYESGLCLEEYLGITSSYSY